MNDPDVIDDLLALLRDKCPGMATVDHAPFAEPIDNFDQQTPAVLAYLAKDGVTGEARTTQPVQPLRLTYGIWLVCKRGEFKAQRQALRESLMGHGFSDLHNPVEYLGGENHDIRGELIWWREYWTTDTWLRN
ncbi:hypothetical protein [Vreelandella venusta]|uniref:hypothetical protein n=1 Tax=Vreelandella venusta TaxID=44935 RepID=UPI0018DA98F8|nr:hypothetical protein [Halomonas venusta]QPI65882.1 hypothetical protein IR195_09375 [Halomonas venusta]